MPFQQLVVDLGHCEPEAAEAACFEAGALAVTLSDAGEHPVLEPRPGETPLWPSVRLTALLPAGAAGERSAGAIAARLGLAPAAYRLERVEDRPWEREWLRDFHPMRFGRRLWVCPGGQPAPVAGAVVLELLDGTELGDARVLDYGCGSGILALAALALGARQAWALDIDPQALLATRENAQRNGLGDRLTITPAESPPPGQFEVVLANILSGPLVELAPQLAGHTAAGGRLVLAGMLDEQAAAVATAYQPWFDMRTCASRDGWTVLAGRKRAE
jgi:ribosomal protein L11 methyltransferase